MTALTYFTLTGTYLPDTSLGSMSGGVTITMLVSDGSALAVPTIPGVVVPTSIPARIMAGQLCDESGNPGVALVANTAALNLSGALFYTVSFNLNYQPTSNARPVPATINPVTFEAPTTAATVDLSSVTPAAGIDAVQVVTVVSGDITDATAIGRELLTASDASGVRSDIGAAAFLGPVASQTAMLALQANIGDYCWRTDLSDVFYLIGAPATSAANWSTVAPSTTGDSILKGNNAGGFANAVAGADYAPPTTGSSLLKANNEGGFTAAVAGTDYAPPTTGSSLLKANNEGGFTAAVAGTDYATVAESVSWSGGAPGVLPATSSQPLTTQSGNTLDDGAGNVMIKGIVGGALVSRRCLRNTIAAVGDSITEYGSYYGYQPAVAAAYVQQLQVLTHQRIRFGAGNFAVAGSTIEQAQQTQLPQVLAMDPLPGACVIASGTNDMGVVPATFNSTSFPSMVSALKLMVASLLNVGVVPILWCIPPKQYNSPIPASQYQPNIHKWNSWVRRYAALNGFPLIDAYTALAQADGTFMPGMANLVTGTGYIHPSEAGHRLIAQQALADGLADIFPPNSLVNTARTTDDLSNLFNNGTLNYGLFTTDSNSDGVADGWTVGFPGTFSLVAPVPSDNLKGNWQQIVAAAGQNPILSAVIPSGGYSVGDVLAFSCRVQTSGVEATGSDDSSRSAWMINASAAIPGGYMTPQGASVTTLYNGANSWMADVQDGEVYSEFTVPSGITSISLFFWLNPAPASGSPTVRIGELTLRNLTQEGLLV